MAHDITCQHIVQLHSEWSKLDETNKVHMLKRDRKRPNLGPSRIWLR